MKSFLEWLAFDLDLHTRLFLIETWFSFSPVEYNKLFDDELEKISASSPEHRDALERMRGFNWVGYIAQSLRNAGYRDQREVQERTHDIVVKLLTGGLFTNYDENRHGPLDKRFKRACGNACRNMVEKDRNRRRFIPSIAIGHEFEPGGVTADDVPDRAVAGRHDDERVIDDFRQLVRSRLGELGLAVLQARMDGQETKSLVGREDLGRPGRFVIKRIVQEIKALAREHALAVDDPGFAADVERAFQRESETVAKRKASTAAR